MTATNQQVPISAEVRKDEEEKKDEKILRSERYYGSQFRGFTLPHDIDEGKAEAKYEGGVLMLTLPKKEAPTTRRVAVA